LNTGMRDEDGIIFRRLKTRGRTVHAFVCFLFAEDDALG